MTGWRKRTIMEMAREANLPACHTTHPKALERFAKLVREDALAQSAPVQEPDSEHRAMIQRGVDRTTPPAATEKAIRLPPGFKAFAIVIETKLKEKNT